MHEVAIPSTHSTTMGCLDFGTGISYIRCVSNEPDGYSPRRLSTVWVKIMKN